MEIRPDFSQEVIPPKPGRYRARIDSVEQKTSQAGNAFLNWKLWVRTPQGDFSVFHRTMLSGKGAGFLKQFIQAAYNPNYSGGPINTDEFVGRTLNVLLRDQFNNQTGQKTGYLEVDRVDRDTSSEKFEDAPADQRSFNEEDIPF